MVFPQPNGEFEWVQASWGAALRCRPLAEIAPHWFSTRQLVLDGVRVEDGAGWEELAASLGVTIDALVRMRQVHGSAIFEPKIATPLHMAYEGWPEADIAVTDDPAFALSIRAADCVPVLMADRLTGAVAAIHAGWRGTASGTVMAAVRVLETRFGVRPQDVVAAVGPSIGSCCYEVGGELVPNFATHPECADWFGNEPRLHLNLWRATRDQLLRAGVAAGRIHVCGLCTADHAALFHSYRRDGIGAGRLIAAIRSGRGTTP
jgi:YfiH family protein